MNPTTGVCEESSRYKNAADACLQGNKLPQRFCCSIVSPEPLQNFILILQKNLSENMATNSAKRFLTMDDELQYLQECVEEVLLCIGQFLFLHKISLSNA